MFNKSSEFNRYIDEARGFLNALRFLGAQNSTMWINAFPIVGSLESSIEAYILRISDDFECMSKTTIKGKELKKKIREEIFDKLIHVDERKIIRELEWQYFEYFGLASTSVNENNAFSPLSSEETFLLELKSKEYLINVCMVTPVSNHIVVVTIGELKT